MTDHQAYLRFIAHCAIGAHPLAYKPFMDAHARWFQLAERRRVAS